MHAGLQNIHLRLLLCLSNVGVQAALLCGVWLHIEAHQLADHLLEEHGDGISGERAVGVYPMVRADILHVGTEHIGIEALAAGVAVGIVGNVGKGEHVAAVALFLDLRPDLLHNFRNVNGLIGLILHKLYPFFTATMA